MNSGERPIKLRNSWFSAKSILVERLKILYFGVELLINDGGEILIDFNKTSNTK